ncbi:MAG: ATP-binding protein [Steroidobacteraceae bacterium]
MLSIDGRNAELGARAFDLLLVLVENHGRLVTKATLLERVWPRLYVDENNLPAQIASLRRVLGAGAIRTVAGFGYRLELPVTHPGAMAPASDAAATASKTPVATLAVPRRAWPNRLGPLIGRERDVQEVDALLDRTSLVTIVGIAGAGKSRLAQEILLRAGDRPRCAAAWIALQPISELQHVPSAIALSLGIALPEGREGFAALRQALEHVPVLLLFDGAEHLGDALAAPLAELVLQTQGVRALVTSQAPLGIAGETVYRLGLLEFPAGAVTPADALHFAAVELFVQRAQAADRRFELTSANCAPVVEICRRLDGNALAIELAAARVPALGVSGLLERLDDRFRLLKASTRGAEPRHGALHAAFDWSYSLLSAAEQRVFNRLGAFAGSFSLATASRSVADEIIDTAEAIDLVGRLVDRSLVTALPTEPPRYALLETARYYTAAKLASGGELADAQRRMAAAMLQMLDTAYQEYWSLDEAIWLHRYEPELDNVRAAIDWAAANDRALGVALYGSAWPLFVEAELRAEGRDRFEQAVSLLSDSLPPARIGRFWEAVASYDASRQYDRARYAAELAVAMHAAADDQRARYYALAQLAFSCRDDEKAARAATDAARSIEDPSWPARLLTCGALAEGAVLMNSGDFVAARAAYRRAVRYALTVSERQALAASVSIVELDIACGDPASALQLGRPLELPLRHSGRRAAHFDLLVMNFCALLDAGEIDEARATGAEICELASRLDASRLYAVLDAMACLACRDHRFGDAARILACADQAHEAHGQLRRRPVQQRLRAAVTAQLDVQLGAAWQTATVDSRDRCDELAACELALGLST